MYIVYRVLCILTTSRNSYKFLVKIVKVSKTRLTSSIKDENILKNLFPVNEKKQLGLGDFL